MQKNFKLIIVLLLVSIILFSVFNISVLNDEITENQYNRLVNDLSNVTSNFITWIGNKQEMLDTAKDLVDNFEYDELIKYKTLNPYLNINNDDDDVSQVYIGLSNGDFITGGQWIPPSDYDPRTRVWYQDAVAADDIIVSPVYVDRETGDQLVTISSVLYMEDSLAGVISADVFLNNISDYLNNILTDGNSYIYLTDKEGTVIAHTDKPDQIGKNIYTDIQNTNIIKYFDEAKSTSNIVRMRYDYGGKRIQGIVQNVSKGNWYLTVASVDDRHFFFRFSLSKNNLIFNFIIITVILTLLYILIKMKSEQDKMNKLLIIDNEMDFLTGIYNRRYFDLWVDNVLKNSNDTKKISLFMMDIDYFKEYNDTYGHIKGDEVIKAVAKTINEQIRKGDVFARYGGEEFVLFMKDVTEETALQIAEKLRASIAGLNISHEKSSYQHITISIGVVTLVPTSVMDLSHFVDIADLALYKAKRGGRNVVYVEKDSL